MINFPPNDDAGIYEEPPRPRRTTQAVRLDQIDQSLGRIETRISQIESHITQITHRLKIDGPLEAMHPCGFCAGRGGTGCDLCQLLYCVRPAD